MGINVLSLFDGMSCGRIALERAGIKVDNYYASEIDKYAIQVSKHNYPDIKHIGDVTQINAKDLPRIDLLIGGSPCQDLSSLAALHGDSGLLGEKSSLFYQYLRLLKETKPTYFLLENVVMKQKYQDAISSMLGVKPILINSALVSAHTRKRLYWTNIPGIEQPEDMGITLQSILESGYTEKQKAYCLTATYNNACPQNYFIKSERQHKFLFPVQKFDNTFIIDSRVNITIKPSLGANGQREELNEMRKYTSKLTPTECERLQNIPDGYTSVVKTSERYRVLGNGWNVGTITHIFQNITTANQIKQTA